MASRKLTSVRQLELMVEYMAAHTQLAVGRLCGKEYAAAARRLWEQLADALNAEGPSRSWKEWSKIWIEAKSKVRKKLMDERAGISGTGGGPHTSCVLTPIQERIADIIGRDVGPIPGARVEGQVPLSHGDSIAHTESTACEDEGEIQNMLVDHDHQYEVPDVAVIVDVEGPSFVESPRSVPRTPQPMVVPDSPPVLLTRRRRRPPPTIRPNQRPRLNIGNSDDRVTPALSSVQETLARIELLRAEAGRDLAAAAVQQARAATVHAEAAMRQAQAWEMNAEALLAVADALKTLQPR